MLIEIILKYLKKMLILPIIIFISAILLGNVLYLATFPIILLLFMITISVIPFLGSIPESWTLSLYSKQILHALINLVIVSKLYSVLSYCYFILNYKLTLKGFKVFTIIVGLLFLSYLVSARYLLYLKLEYLPIPFWLYITFYFSSLGLILRGLTTLTLFIVPYIIFSLSK